MNAKFTRAAPSPRYRRLLESKVADLRNTSGRPYGYPITAATFLENFVGGGPWAHVDMLGPALLDEDAIHTLVRAASPPGAASEKVDP